MQYCVLDILEDNLDVVGVHGDCEVVIQDPLRISVKIEVFRCSQTTGQDDMACEW